MPLGAWAALIGEKKMKFGHSFLGVLTLVVCLLSVALIARGQAGTSGTIEGTVTDPEGAAVPGATVTIHNPVSGYQATATTDSSGKFSLSNVPFNPYHMTVTSKGFSSFVQDVEVRSILPVTVPIKLELAGVSTTVTVESGQDLIENTPTAHTDISRQLFQKVPLESQSSSLSSLVTEASPGVTSDSNGLFHGLGDHAENSFSLDGQPITDQQSKVFSNQIPTEAVQSMEVIEGAPPAQYGDKTSLVIDVTTRSGQGETTPHGSIKASYGTFGSSTGGFDLGYGGTTWGNFIAVNGLNTGRFLDPPEYSVMHDKGNEENVFDRVDYQFDPNDTAHLDFQYSRSWFQTPNSFDSQFASPWWGVVVDNGGIAPNAAVGCANAYCGQPVGPADQRSQIGTFDIAPTWNHIINMDTIFTLEGWARRDAYNYYPSQNPFADLGTFNLQRESVGQDRTLLNSGARASVSYVKGIHNVKAGISYEQTLLNENDKLGIVDPTFNAPCIGPNTNLLTGPYTAYASVQGLSAPSQCAGAGLQANVNPNAPASSLNPNPLGASIYPLFNSTLLPYDLTRGGTPYSFYGHTDVKELAMYVEDSITWKNFDFSLGVRGDLYNGLSVAREAEPRLGVAYNFHQTNTVLRFSYARTMETPFNENLVLSSLGCSNPVLNPLLACSSSSLTPIAPGRRDEYHVGLQQAFGRYLVFDGEYIWKYTTGAYDFSVLGNTPITFPIEWAKSKIPGFTARVNLTNYHGVTAYVVMSSVAARFFLPQVGGAGATPSAPSGVFRIDHDEQFNQTTHMQYQIWKNGPWLGFNWRYDSGLVAGAVPCYGVLAQNDCPQTTTLAGQPAVFLADPSLIPFSPDQQYEAGFTCNGVHAAPPTATNPFGVPLSYRGVVGVCPTGALASNLVKIPASGTENDDKNPPRIQARNLFDLAVGDDNLFHGDRYRWSAQVTVINLANAYVLYNFLSTFSGTHYVTPRAITAQVGFHF